MTVVDGFFELMSRGGPVMWVILVTAWVAMVLLVERACQLQLWLHRARRDRTWLSQREEGPLIPDAYNRGSPMALVHARIQWSEVNSRADLARQLKVHFSELMPRLEGGLPTIAVLGSLLPMLGLLGTVTGMIEVFQAIALHGTGRPDEMAQGISQALLTTAAGLLIALPVIFAHHLLVRRLRLLLVVTEQSLLMVYHREGMVLAEGGHGSGAAQALTAASVDSQAGRGASTVQGPASNAGMDATRRDFMVDVEGAPG